MEDGEKKRGPSARFPLEWKYDHFQRGKSHIFRNKDLNGRDMVAYWKLVAFVDRFRLRKCTLPNGDQLFDENEQPLLAARHINTKAILECETEGEAMVICTNCLKD